MEEYRDLDLTIAVFTRLLEDPRLRDLEAGIVLQAYLPDALAALQRADRVGDGARAAGGARIKVRLVKGANLAMERVDADRARLAAGATYGPRSRPPTPTTSGCLEWALQPSAPRAVRVGVAGHNLFDLALRVAAGRGARRARAASSSRCCSAWRRARWRR